MTRMLRAAHGRRLVAVAVVAAGIVVSAPSAMLQVPATDASLFDDTVLQRIDLQVNQRDWDTLRERFQANTYYPAAFTWRGQTVQNVGIRSRGSGSRSGVKPGLTVDFDRYVTGQQFLGLKALVLDNHLQDPSAVRDAVAMALISRFGLPAPREAHAEIHVNGQFFGVYTIVENVDSVATRRMFAPPPTATPPAPASATGRRARLRNPPPEPVGSAPANVPTGYLFEYNWVDYYYETYLGFDLDPYVERFEAETRDDEPLENLYRPIERMFREIAEAPDGQFLERVGPHLDLQSYVRMAAVELFLADYDGVVGEFGTNNFYLYRAADGGPHRLIAWDADGAFHAVDYGLATSIEQHLLLRRALQVPDLRRLFVDTLLEAAAFAEAKEPGQPLGWLEFEVVRRHGLMQARHEEDRVRPQPLDELLAAVNRNIEFARRRPGIVRQQLADLQQAWSRR